MSKSLSKTVTIDDLQFANVVARQDLQWAVNILEDIKHKIKEIKADCVEKGVHPYTFNNLETFLDINDFTMKNRCDYYDQQVEELGLEIDALNKGASK